MVIHLIGDASSRAIAHVRIIACAFHPNLEEDAFGASAEAATLQGFPRETYVQRNDQEDINQSAISAIIGAILSEKLNGRS
ncbi:MAG: hypothetical protein LBI39_02110 [Puniceicoccales bacterium]|jgi:hypothetical protein|nr:hypothetical protein [Puniceicoccales bacterium]